MAQDTLTIIAVGDLRPGREKPDSIFEPNAHILKAADITIGQLEAPYSTRGSVHIGRGAARRMDPKNIPALARAGFDVISFASNHALDYGYDAYHDTIQYLKDAGLAVVGVGENLAEARKPVIIEKKGTKVAVLAYNSITMGVLRGYTADVDRPGCNPLRAYTTYEPIGYGYQPGTPAKAITFAYPEDKERMIEDIKAAKSAADIVIVWHHAGVIYVPAVVADYQKETAHAAIDAGADIVFQHHAHILKGVETYKGKAIFYGLGNFAFDSEAKYEKRWRQEIEEYYGIIVEPGWELYPFPAGSRNSMAVKCTVAGKKIQKVTYLPGLVNQQAATEILTRKDPRAEQVYRYIEDISKHEKLNIRFGWEGDEVVIS